MSRTTIYDVECKIFKTDRGEYELWLPREVYERRFKEHCGRIEYKLKLRIVPLSVVIPVEAYFGGIVQRGYAKKMTCKVILTERHVEVVQNGYTYGVTHEDEEESGMSKKEINEERYAREAAEAIRKGMQEYRQYRDQMRAPVPPAIMDIKFNGPATIIFWGDGTKTVVKKNDNEPYYDKEKAIAMAIIKKTYPGFAYHKLFNLDEYFGKQLRAAEKKRDSILSQIKDARKPKVTARLEQELYKIDDEIARLKKEVEKFE